MIQVAFSASGGIGALIRDFTGGEVNHAFLIFYDPVFDAKLTLGANANGLTIEPLDAFPNKIVHVFEPVDLSKGLELGLRLWIHLLNQPYDFAGLVGMAIVEAARKLGDHQARNPLLSEHRLFCSEYVKKVLISSGYDILPHVSPGDCDPAQLCEALKASHWFQEVKIT